MIRVSPDRVAGSLSMKEQDRYGVILLFFYLSPTILVSLGSGRESLTYGDREAFQTKPPASLILSYWLEPFSLQLSVSKRGISGQARERGPPLAASGRAPEWFLISSVVDLTGCYQKNIWSRGGMSCLLLLKWGSGQAGSGWPSSVELRGMQDALPLYCSFGPGVWNYITLFFF